MAGINGPETGGQTQPTPEQAATEQVTSYIQQKVQQIRDTFNRSRQEFKDKFNEIKQKAADVEELEKEEAALSGDPTNEAGSTSKNKQILTGVWTHTTLNIVHEMDKDNFDTFAQEMGLNERSQKFIKNLSNFVTSEQHSADEHGMTYLYKIINNTFENNIPNIFKMLKDDEFKYMAQLNPALYMQVIDSISATAGELHLDPKSIGQFLQRRQNDIRNLNEGDESEQEGRKGNYAESAFLSQFSSLRREPWDEASRALEFYEAIKKPDPRIFIKYFDTLSESRQIREDLVKYRQENDLPEINDENELRLEARKFATSEIHKTIEYIVNTIYATTLSQHPHHNFTQTAAQLGRSFANPEQIFNQALSSKLIAMTDAVKDFEAKSPGEAHGLDFFVYKRDENTFYDENLGRMRTVRVPTSELTKIEHFSHFAESLKEIASVEKGALEFQFNLMWIMHHPPAEGLFKAIQQFAAENIKTETIDNLYIFPHNETLSAGVMSLESQYKRVFSETDWRKVPDVETAFLEHLTPAELATQNHMNETFREQGVPQWAINRAFYHARLMSFGKEFMFQLISSYADPNLGEDGKPSYLGEGVFSRNSVFDVWEGAKRWGPGTDPYLYGLPTMPWDGFIKKFFPVELQKEGEGRWTDSFKYGKLAYFSNKEVFRNFNSMMSRHNITRMGGVDAYGGWRMKYSYSHWLNEIWNFESRSLDLKKGNDQMLVDGWKSIENIGTNVLRHYVDDMISSPGKQDDFSKLDKKYENLFRFLHKRYFTEGVGKSMYEGTGLDEEDAFWNNIKNSIENTPKKIMTPTVISGILKEHMYNALTVALSERMPTEFMYMEKKRGTQNGVKIEQELLEKFVHRRPTETPSPWAHHEENEQELNKYWKQAQEDVMYVQEMERIRSIKQMKKLTAESTRNGHSNKLGVLYGDLSQDRSIVNYKIDRSVIERELRKKYNLNQPGHGGHADPQDQHGNNAHDAHAEGHGHANGHGIDGNARLERALDFYDSLMDRIVHKPKDGKLEAEWNKGKIHVLEHDLSDRKNQNKWDWKQKTDQYEARKLKGEAEAWKKNRSNLFSQYWKDWEWGMQFTADTAGQFMNRSATGEETIARTAEACSVVAEETKKYIAGGDWIDGMNGVIRGGRGKWDEVQSGITKVYSSIKSEDGVKAKEITRHIANWTIMGLRRDDRALGAGARIGFQINRIKTSVAATKVDEGVAADLDKSDVYDFMVGFAEKNILPRFTPTDDQNYKRVEIGSNPAEKAMLYADQAIAKITGKAPPKRYKYVRDMSGEVSAESVRGLHKASQREYSLDKGIPILGAAAAIAIFLIVRKALDEAANG